MLRAISKVYRYITESYFKLFKTHFPKCLNLRALNQGNFPYCGPYALAKVAQALCQKIEAYPFYEMPNNWFNSEEYFLDAIKNLNP